MRAFALALLCALLAAGCTTPDGASPPTTPTGETPSPTPDPSGPPEPAALRFDGDRAFELVREQVLYPNGSVRTRVPGTPGNAEVANWIADELSAEGYGVSWHHFNATYGCEQVPMHNVVAERTGTSGRMVVFGAHYDTRPVADKDPDPEKQQQPIPGANDAGSGVAVLMELARVLPETSDTVRFVFFDGEDGGGYKGNDCTDWILGSRAYAGMLPEDEIARMDAFVLVDMVGDPDLRLPWEINGRSTVGGRALQNDIWAVAGELGHEEFVTEPGYAITDDHVPFIERGVPSVDLIHLLPRGEGVFPDWHHAMHDDLDHVSAASLAAVGETLEAWMRSRAAA